MDPLRAGLLTIGTEVSTGQIVNSNASWLADQLVNLKFDPVIHLTVADTEAEIIDALNYLAKKTSYVFVTGGLGPTRDDLTRQVLANWCGAELIFDQNSWLKIEQRFQQLGVPPPPSNRQQCYFPIGSRIIDNPRGTANAFALSHAGLHIWCLPGPPDEIKSIWNSSLRAELASLGNGVDDYQLFRWQCLGLSESALGEIVEKVIMGSQLISGYRPHLPYIEIKIWCQKSLLATEQVYLDRLDQELQRWTLAKNDEDPIDAFLEAIQAYPRIHIQDAATFGAIGERLGQALSRGKQLPAKLRYECHLNDEDFAKPTKLDFETLLLQLHPIASDGHWHLSWRTAHVHHQAQLKLPFRHDRSRLDRERKYICEMSLASWSRHAHGVLLA